MIMEALPTHESLRRSWHLTKSRVWRLLGLSLLTFAVVSVSSALVGAIIGFMVGYFFGEPAVYDVVPPLATFGGQTIGLALAAPITTVCYCYLRADCKPTDGDVGGLSP